MKRRDLLKNMATGAGALALGLHMPMVRAGDYPGKLFVFVQADGGWDPTSFCDPKVNTADVYINNWAQSADVQQAGNIPYAPFASNQAFFEKYYQRMLIINGVDAQTNSHTVGVVHNWSGRVSEGFPSMSALLSACYAPELAMSYLNFGGFAQTAGVSRYTRINNPNLVTNIAYPNLNEWDPNQATSFVQPADWETLKTFRDAQLTDLVNQGGLAPRALRNRQYYQSALASSEELNQFAALIPPSDQQEQPQNSGNFWSNLRQQVQVTTLAFKSGVSIAADLFLGGFDTHQNHDADASLLFGWLTDGVDFLWESAESLGIADRLIVVIGSDFGRTPAYNADQGKDHWPIGSYVIMEKNQPWTNRVVGETDEGHNAFAINPTSRTRDDTNGTIIYPKHVHKALRNHLGIGNAAVATPFPFNNTEDFTFFA